MKKLLAIVTVLFSLNCFAADGYNMDCVVQVDKEEPVQMNAREDSTGLPLYAAEMDLQKNVVLVLAEVTGKSIKFTVQDKISETTLMTSEGPFVDAKGQDYLLYGQIFKKIVNMNCLVK